MAGGGEIVKGSAADKSLFESEGRAVVFESLQDLAERIDSDDLEATPADFLVLKHAGPTSASGMPEAGYLPIPGKLAPARLKDILPPPRGTLPGNRKVPRFGGALSRHALSLPD